MNYLESLDFLHELCSFGINLGLDRIFKLLEYLDRPQDKLKFIHVAGTNGKGSTTSMMTEVLIKAGYKVGVYTSPHLHSYTERIKINNVPIPEEKFAKEMEKLQGLIPKVLKSAGESPTEFEVLTALALDYFKKERVDIAIMEVGMGGRLDSTNVITPLISVITPIAKDHEKYLGTTLSEIAFEKAGIIKENIPVVIGNQEKACIDVLTSEAKKKNAPVYFSDSLKVEQLSYSNLGQEILLKQDEVKTKVFLSLLGDHQIQNMKAALTSLNVLKNLGFKISLSHIKEGLKDVKWPGRLEYITQDKNFVLDGGHNPEGAKALSHALKKYFKYNKLIMVLGILGDKDQKKMVEYFLPVVDEYIVTKPMSFRANNWEDVAEMIKESSNNKVYVEEDIKKAILKAVNLADKNDLICVTGSLYLIGDAREFVLNNIPKA